MNYYPFDSRNNLYKSKIGALAEGETLRLKVLLHRDAKVHSVFLILRNDNEPLPQEIVMEKGEWLGDYRYFSCEITPEEGLFWYSFRYTSEYGEYFITKTETSLGIVSRDGAASWQLTVYKKNFKTPTWLEGGIIYQIFPDRFCNSGKEKANVPDDRYICTDWEKQPEFRQNDKPLYLGNDYYGGDLLGIAEKLSYLKSLGVSCIYLNPIFEAHSNHRYNTADYFKIDPTLGTEEDLCLLIKKAEGLGIHIVLDGVFSHTGDDSIYFNKYGRYEGEGAYQSEDSPYFEWFNFEDYPDTYKSWWGISTLPETNEDNPAFTEFITGENGVLRYWLKKGIKGWRLDVADELPDAFLDNVRKAIKSEGEENYLLGEVWEDATNKISYGKRRRFLRGEQLDSVMNYPFANAIICFLRDGGSKILVNRVLNVVENYPAEAVKLLMNHVGTHDTERIITRLGNNKNLGSDREAQSVTVLSDEEYDKATKLLKLAAVLQYTLPGVPSVYYGDEAGLQGFGDPFCRGTYPWGKENTDLLGFYKKLGKVRRNTEAFKKGDFIPFYSDENVLAYIRKDGKSRVLISVNRAEESFKINLTEEILSGKTLIGDRPRGKTLNLKPYGYSVIEF